MSDAPNTEQKPRDPKAKGRRPFFFDDPNTDKLLAMVLALAGEVSLLRDRLDTHERLAREGLPGTPENIEAYAFTESQEDERATQRAASIDRVLRIAKQGSDDDLRAAEKAYAEMVDDIAQT
jgi:hypothetical protein